MTQRLNISSGSPYESVFGYSRAVRVGDHVHVSGTCAPPDHEGRPVYDQAKAALEIIGKALQQAGGGFRDVVRTVVYVTDMAEAPEVARAHLEVFGEIRPATSLIQITSALRAWQKVEIEAYAILGG